MKSLRPRVQRSRSCTIRRAHAAPRSATRYVDHPVFLTQTRALILTSLRQVRRRLAPGVYEKAQALFVYAKQATLHALFIATYPAHKISLKSFKLLIPWYVRRAKEETCLCKACLNFKGYMEVLNSLSKVSPTLICHHLPVTSLCTPPLSCAALRASARPALARRGRRAVR